MLGLGLPIPVRNQQPPSLAAGEGPTNIALSANDVAESSAAGTVVGSLTADLPANSHVEWTLTDSASDRFVIGGMDDDQIVVGWTQFDRSVATSYSITVQASAYSNTGALIGSISQQLTINITAVTTPAGLAVLPLNAADFRHGVTTSGADITAVDAAWSATGGGLTAASDTEPQYVATGGVVGQPAAYIGPTQFFSHTATGNLSAFDISYVIAPLGDGGTPDLVLSVGTVSNTTNYIQLRNDVANYDEMVVRANDGVFATMALTRAVIPGRAHKVRVVFDGTNVTAFVDDVQAATSASLSGKVFNFSRIGRRTSTAANANYYLFVWEMYGAALTGGDITALSEWNEPWRRQRQYVAAAGSDTAATGWISSTPVLTVARGTAGMRPGDFALFNRGDTWRGQTISGSTGTVAAPVGYGAYGTGNKPKFYGTSATISSGWTNTTGNEWTRTLAYKPLKVWLPNDEAHNYGHLWDSTEPSDFTITDFQFSHATTTLTIVLANGLDPNTFAIEICEDNAVDFTNTSLDYQHFYDLDVKYWSQDAFDFASSANFLIKRCDVGFCASDLIDTSGSSVCWVVDSVLEGAGINWYAGSSDGDPTSAHGTSQLHRKRNIVRRNLKSGGLSQRSTTTSYDRDLIIGNNQNIGVSDAGTGDGAITLTNNEIVNLISPLGAGSAAEGYVNTMSFITGAGTLTVEIFGNTIYSDDPANGFVGINVATSGGTLSVTANGNIIMGFATGTQVGATENLTENYNNYFDNTNDRAGQHNGGSGAGANDIDADPQFVDAANNDFTPQVAMPANDNGLTYDYYGADRASPPTMGAVEAAA